MCSLSTEIIIKYQYGIAMTTVTMAKLIILGHCCLSLETASGVGGVANDARTSHRVPPPRHLRGELPLALIAQVYRH